MSAFKQWDILQGLHSPIWFAVVSSKAEDYSTNDWKKVGVVKFDPKPIEVGCTVVRIGSGGDFQCKVLYVDDDHLLIRPVSGPVHLYLRFRKEYTRVD